MTPLTTLITKDRIVLRRRAADWRQAIRSVARPLVEDGSIAPSYVESMIRSVEEFGPYIVITPHLALAHARPEGGVRRQAMSVMTLAEPVDFGHPDNDPVDLVFCLAAVDSGSHLEALRAFVAIAGDRDLQRRLVGAATVNELQGILRGA